MKQDHQNSASSGFQYPSIIVALFCTLVFYTRVDIPIGNWLGDTLDKKLVSEQESNIVLLTIDPKSIDAIGIWPWSRDIYARAIDKLAQAEINKLFIDIDFSSPRDASSDKKLWRSIDNLAEKTEVLVPVFLQYSDQRRNELHLTKPPIPNHENVTLTSVNVAPDIDGRVRYLSGGITHQNIFYPSAASALSNQKTDRQGKATAIDYTIHPTTFEYHSFIDFVNGDVSLESLKQRNVIIGATAVELGDNLSVPIFGSLPGAVVQALAAQTLKDGPIKSTNRWVYIATVSAFLWLITLPLRKARWHRLVLFSSLCLLAAWSAIIVINIALRINLSLSVPLIFIVVQSLVYSGAKFNASTLENLRLRFGIEKRESILSAVFNNSNDCMLCINEDNSIKYVSKSLADLLCTDSEHLIATSVSDIISNYLAITNESNEDLEKANHRYTSQLLPTSGPAIPIEFSINPIAARSVTYYAVIIRDLREQIQREQELRHQSLHDRLTDLPNRKYLYESVAKYLHQQKALTVFLLNLNHFKEINDLYGHECGDAVLLSFAERLKRKLSKEATCFRLDGAVLAITYSSKLSSTEIQDQANLLQYTVKEPIHVENYTVELDVSIGVSQTQEHQTISNTELMRQADIALQNSKETHQLYAVFDAQLKNKQVAYLEIIPLLRRAIENDELQVHFQPKVDLASDTILGCELLTRWTTKDGVSMPPDLFITVAENSQLMESLMFSCMFKLIELQDDWKKWGLPPKVAINLSSRLLGNPTFIGELISCVDTLLSHLDIEFEITETALMANPVVALKSIAAIKASGHKIAIDDFGVGYSSLAYIRDLGADTLKIDKSFIDDIVESEDSKVIVRSTIGMAHELGLSVVAEGIEDSAQEKYLKNVGCDFGQGYLYAKAMDFRSYTVWCKQYGSDMSDFHSKASRFG